MMISVKKKKDQGKKTTSIGKLQRRESSKKLLWQQSFQLSSSLIKTWNRRTVSIKKQNDKTFVDDDFSCNHGFHDPLKHAHAI